MLLRLFNNSGLIILVFSSMVLSQPIKSFDIKSWSGYFEAASFSDQMHKDWFSSRQNLRDNEKGFSEAIFLRLKGSIYHPRLLSWTGEGKFSFKQRFLSNGFINSDRNIFEGFKEYNLSFSLLREHPTSLRFFISRGISNVDGDFLQDIFVKNNNFGGNISSVRGKLKQILDFRRSHYITEGLFTINELRKTIAYDANIRSKRLYTNFKYNYNDNDFITTRKTYITHSARFSNNYKIDHTGKNNISGQLSFFQQENTIINRYYEGSVSSSIDILDNLTNKISYTHRNNKVASINSLANSWDISLIHYLYRSLITTAAFKTYKNKFDPGEEMDVNPSLNLNYRKTTFFGGLKLNYNFGYREHKVDKISIQSDREIFIYSSGIPITLSNSNIDTSTIVITDAGDQQAVPYLEFIDYIIELSGSSIQIIIPLISSIQDGDSIQVTYITSNDNYYKYDELTNIYGFSIGYHRTISFDVRHSKFNRTLLDGFSSVNLDDVDIDWVNLTVRFQKLIWEGSYYNLKSIRNPVKRRRVSAKYYYSLSNRINLVINGSFLVSDFSDVSEQSEQTNFSIDTWYHPRRNLTVKSRVLYRKKVGRSDDGYSWIFSNIARYNLHMLLIELSFNIYNQKVDIVGTEDRTIAKINIKRAF